MPLRTDSCVRVVTLAMLVTCADSWLFSWSVRAAPPTPRVVAATLSLPSNAQWINHEVVFGESLNEIADRYAVSVGSILGALLNQIFDSSVMSSRCISESAALTYEWAP